jgi:WD40 repeat protein
MFASLPRNPQLSQLLTHYEHSLSANTPLDDTELIAQHPELMPQLALELKKRRLVFQARRVAESRTLAQQTAQAETPAHPQRNCEPSQSLPLESPQGFDDYELLELIGHGGMGVVYKAWQRSLERTVAVKMMRLAEFASAEDLQRFRAEAAASARLDHPAIVAVHDVGVAYPGETREVPYFSMAFVQGRSLQQLLQDAPLPARAAAAHLATVADAIDYAHAQGVLHRDLKPHNILIDENEQPRVTDFGLSKRLDGAADLTLSGQIIGTPGYMPPEQALAEHQRVSPRSDIYSLGATLYACLTSRAPFVGDKPTEVLLQVIRQMPLSLRTLNPGVPRDLEVICFKCLEKDPARRYESAAHLAADLRRFLNHEPILARPAGAVERLGRWCRRQPWRAAAVGLAATALLLVLLIGVGGALSAQIQSSLRRQAEEKKAESDRHLILAEARQTQLQHKLAELHLEAHSYDKAAESLNYVPQHLASWDTWRLRNAAALGPSMIGNLPAGYWSMLDADLHLPSGRLVTTDASGLVIVWNLEQARIERELTTPRFIQIRPTQPKRPAHFLEDRGKSLPWQDAPDCYAAVRWEPDGKSIVAAGLNGRVVRISVASGELQELCRLEEPVYSLDLGDNGALLALGGGKGGLHLRRSNGEAIATTEGKDAVVAVQRLGESRWLIGRSSGQVQVIDSALRELASVQTPAPLWSLAVSRTGLVAVGGGSATLSLLQLDAKSGRLNTLSLNLRLPGHLQPPPEAVHALRFSTDGEQLYAGDNHGRVTCWKIDSQEALWHLRTVNRNHPGRSRLANLEQEHPELALLLPLQRTFAALIPGRDSRELVTVADDAAARLWRLGQAGEFDVLRFAESVGPNPRLAFDRQHPERIWTLSSRGKLGVYDSFTGRKLAEQTAHDGGLDLAVSTSGIVATAGGETAVRCWKFAAKSRKIVPFARAQFVHDRPLLSVALSPGDRWIAAVDDQSQLVVWDFATGDLRFLSPLSSSRERPLTGRVAFNSEGRYLAAFGAGQSAPVFATEPFRRLDEQLSVAGGGGRALCWSVANPLLVRATDDYPRCIQQLVGGGRLWSEQERVEGIGNALTISPDGRRWLRLEQGGQVVCMSHDNFLTLYKFRNPRGLDADLALDPSGRRLAIAGLDGAVEIWETGPAQPPIEVKDDSQNWLSRPFLRTSAKAYYSAPTNVRFDPQGRLSALLSENSDNAPLPLYFVRQTRQNWSSNRSRWMARRPTDAFTFAAFGWNGRPMANR